MDKPKYIINFTVWSGADERKILYFDDKRNAEAVYASLNDNDAVCDLYMSEVIASGTVVNHV